MLGGAAAFVGLRSARRAPAESVDTQAAAGELVAPGI